MSENPVSENPASSQPLANDQLFDEGFEAEAFEPVPNPPVSISDPNDGWSISALVVGTGIVAIALSGLLDDSGIAEHPSWVVPAAAVLIGCLAVVIRTLQGLVRPTR